MTKKYTPFSWLIIAILLPNLFLGCKQGPAEQGGGDAANAAGEAVKLYWFIPDGVRAEPELFNIYKWAEEGKLPNIKKMMDNGTYGYSKPVFPTHTPVNFATLLTGTMPHTHGVADGPMHTGGNPLNKVSVGGFRSVARKVPAAWKMFEDSGKKVAVISTPGSTPPEIDQGIVVRGRWGGWGADMHAINFEKNVNGKQRYNRGRGSRLFFFGPQLTQYLDPVPASGWDKAPKSFSPPTEATLAAWGATVYAYIYDSTDDKKVNYDRVAFSADKKNLLGDIGQGEWSGWSSVTLKWNGKEVPSNYMFHVIKLDGDGFFRIRIFYNNVNRYITQPPEVAGQLTENVGPMVDFVDNFPPQLIHYPEDKQTFLDELHKSFDWHTKAIPYISKTYQPDVVIHDIYSPNQMLTSRWWLGYIDRQSQRYGDVDGAQRDKLWEEVKGMYQRLDGMLGQIMESAGDNTLIVLSSDHGACVLNKWVRLNNYLAKHGYLKFKIDPETGEPNIDWKNSKAIYLKMDGIFIHPDGLEGNWTRASGEEYEKLRGEIKDLLLKLEDEDGTKPVTSAIAWEEAEGFHSLPPDRIGDLVISNKAGYGWNEEMSEDLKLFDIPLKTGYKQAILVEETKSMWTPFVMMGPGVAKGVKLEQPIRHMDQLPTIFTLMDMPMPENVEGEVVGAALAQPHN